VIQTEGTFDVQVVAGGPNVVMTLNLATAPDGHINAEPAAVGSAHHRELNDAEQDIPNEPLTGMVPTGMHGDIHRNFGPSFRAIDRARQDLKQEPSEEFLAAQEEGKQKQLDANRRGLEEDAEQRGVSMDDVRKERKARGAGMPGEEPEGSPEGLSDEEKAAGADVKKESKSKKGHKSHREPKPAGSTTQDKGSPQPGRTETGGDTNVPGSAGPAAPAATNEQAK